MFDEQVSFIIKRRHTIVCDRSASCYLWPWQIKSDPGLESLPADDLGAKCYELIIPKQLICEMKLTLHLFKV